LVCEAGGLVAAAVVVAIGAWLVGVLVDGVADGMEVADAIGVRVEASVSRAETVW
jgi:hypothetical protein